MKLSSNLKLVKDNSFNKEIELLSKFREFYFGLNYVKGDEDSITIKFKVQPIDSDNWFYLSRVNEYNEIEKRIITATSSESSIFIIGDIPQNKKFIIEIDYNGNTIDKCGEIEILAFTYKV